MAIEEVFGDDRRCAVLDIKKLSERWRFTHVMHGKYRNVGIASRIRNAAAKLMTGCCGVSR
jgi:hypothetical protein